MAEVPFEGWAIVELMGHRKRPGRVSEVEMFGGKLLRVDIPAEGGDITEFYGVTSIYALRPCSEEVARQAMRSVYDLPVIRPATFEQIEHRVDPTDAADDFQDFDEEVR